MTKGPIKNVAASVHYRLLNIAKESNRRFSDVLQHYVLERWLYRLSRSAYKGRLILKGALLLTAWKAPVTRPTRDIDLLGRVSNDLDAVRVMMAEIITTPVEEDGVIFDPATVVTERIAEDADYLGVRARFHAHLGNTRIAMQIDIGFSDVVTPGPIPMNFPTIFEQPAVQLLTYNRESVIAEKFEAMVKLGELNSRMKDFFDIWLLATHFPFDGPGLRAAVQATFAQRQTAMMTAPQCLTERFARDPVKDVQWKAFARRGLLTNHPTDFGDVVGRVRAFLQPIAVAISANRSFSGQWPPGGPW